MPSQPRPLAKPSCSQKESLPVGGPCVPWKAGGAAEQVSQSTWRPTSRLTKEHLRACKLNSSLAPSGETTTSTFFSGCLRSSLFLPIFIHLRSWPVYGCSSYLVLLFASRLFPQARMQNIQSRRKLATCHFAPGSSQLRSLHLRHKFPPTFSCTQLHQL